MRVAYLVNQYPSISHTFVRREIEGLERLGIEVEPFSVRPMDEKALPDPKDKLEVGRTHALLAHGAKGPLAGHHACGGLASRPLCAGPGPDGAHGHALRPRTRPQLRLSWRGRAARRARKARGHPCACALRHQLGGGGHARARAGRAGYSFTVHGPEEFDKPDLCALREKIARSRFVVGVSSFGRSQLYRYCDVAHWTRCT